MTVNTVFGAIRALCVISSLCLFCAAANAEPARPNGPATKADPARPTQEIHPISETGIALPAPPSMRPTPSPMVLSDGIDADVASDIGRVLDTLKRQRGLEMKEIVTARKSTAAQLLEYVNRTMNEPSATRQIRVAEAFFRAVGAIPPDCDLADIMRSYMVEEIAGLYDWKDKTLFMAERVYGDLRILTMSHELTHALQDQHFGLRQFMDVRDGVSEPYAAAQALMEGDATLSMLQGRIGAVPSGIAADFMVRSLLSLLDLDERMRELKIPRAIGELLMFPYVAGFKFTVAVHGGAADGWREIDWMWANPPLSTEQVIHPEKAARRDGRAGVDWPRDIRMPDVGAFTAGAAFVGTDIAGESNMAAIFRDLMDSRDADRAAAGWDGDRFVVWRAENGATGLVLASVWDTPQDAIEAATALGRARLKPVAVNVVGDRVVAAWGAAVANPDKLVARIAETMTTREIRTWSDWSAQP